MTAAWAAMASFIVVWWVQTKIEAEEGVFNYVMNTSSGLVHRTCTRTQLDAGTWRSQCGWCFAGSRFFKLMRKLPGSPFHGCDRCGLKLAGKQLDTLDAMP